MNKFAKATKKIAAVAAAATIVSSTAFAGGVNYPTNFVKNDAFNGQVIIGATATADMAAATSIVEDLKADFTGTDNVVITAKKSTGAGDSIDAVKSNEQLNYGETLGDVSETTGFDDTDADVLADERFNNGKSDEDYEQTLKLSNGAFNHALRDNVDGVNNIADGIYYADGDVFATYTLDMKNAVSLTGFDKADFVGETLRIMGNEFTIGSITVSGTKISSIELLGGANKVSLGEGEETTVTVNGESHTIVISSVSSSKVLLSIDGNTESVDLYDSEDVAGISVAVTDLVDSSRDSVKGYATIVVGGQKIKLEDGKKVKINDEDIDDLYPEYEVYASFASSDFDTITLDYKVADDTLLQKGDSLDDVVFQAFKVKYDGTNNVEYKEVKLSVNDDDLDIKGTTEKGEDLTLSLHATAANPGTQYDNVYIKGDQDTDRIFVKNSDLTYVIPTGLSTKVTDIDLTSIADTDTITVGSKTFEANTTGSITTGNIAFDTTAADLKAKMNANGISSEIVSNKVRVLGYSDSEVSISPANGGAFDDANSDADVAGILSFNLTSTGIKGSGFLVSKDSEEQYLYELTSVDTTAVNHEVDFDEWLRGDDESDIKITEWTSKLGVNLANTINGVNHVGLTVNTDLSNIVAFEGNTILNLGNAEDVDTSSSLDSVLYFGLDSADVSADNVDEESDAIEVTLGWDITDKEFDISGVKYANASIIGSGESIENGFTGSTTFTNFVNNGMEDTVDGSSDNKEYVTTYGIKVSYDNDEKRELTIAVPDEQVKAEVSLVFGDSSQEVKTYTVSADAADAKVAELEADGYTVTTAAAPSSNVAFDVTTADIVKATAGMAVEDAIVVGGPAINEAARVLLGVSSYDAAADNFVKAEGQAVARYFADSNSVLVYGYTAADTAAVVTKLNAGTVSFE